MRYTFFILLLALPLMAAAKGRKNPKNAMSQFVASYNNGDAGSLSSIFSPRSTDRGRYTSAKIADLKNRFGQIRSFSYSRQREDGIIIFNVKFVKPKYNDPNWIPNAWVGVRVDEEGKVLRLKFPTTAYLNGGDRYFMMKEY